MLHFETEVYSTLTHKNMYHNVHNRLQSYFIYILTFTHSSAVRLTGHTILLSICQGIGPFCPQIGKVKYGLLMEICHKNLLLNVHVLLYTGLPEFVDPALLFYLSMILKTKGKH